MNLLALFPRKFAAMALAVLMLAMAVVLPAHAAIDLTDTQTEVLATIGVVSAFIAAIGAAVLAFVFVAKGFKWARRAG